MTQLDHTIAAIATPGGEGGVGIIRLSGSDALQYAQSNIQRDVQKLEPRHSTLANFTLSEEDEVLDQGLITYFPEPNSYTGENVLEFSCHGSPLLLQTLLEDLIDNDGIRLAEPGEFTRRAFENEKMDLAQADAVASLISAKSRAALRSSARQLEGELSDVLEELRETLIFCRSRIEAGLDFSDEDSVGEIPFDELHSKLDTLLSKIKNLIEEGQQGKYLEQGCRTAIVGRPNVGKSSLLNRFLETDRAIVTPQPGTTRDVISDQIEIDGIPFKLFDTAGIHEAPDEIEAEGVRRSKNTLEEADLILFLLDGSEPLRETDEVIYEMIKSRSTIVALNKTDLDQKIDDSTLKSKLQEPDCKISAKTGNNLEDLKKIMKRTVIGDDVNLENPLVTQTRHVQALQKSKKSIERSLRGIQSDRDPTLIAQDLAEASEAVGKITGNITTDDVLDKIFSTFCIGK